MSTYIGRFAPSPTGNLHFGSLVTAVASFLQARSQKSGKWLLRIEDIDISREVKGASDRIIRTLESHQLLWDDDIIYQSRRLDTYQHYLDELQKKVVVYPCQCNRKRMQSLFGIYDKHCLSSPPPRGVATAQRVHLPNTVIHFVDGLFGTQKATRIDDFILVRKDSLFSYQFVVVIDDYLQKITEVVRGCDLLSSTPKQIALFNSFSWASPHWLHLPLVMGEQEKKLSKQNHAMEIDTQTPGKNLYRALQTLGQHPPEILAQESASSILRWAITHWDLSKIPKTKAYP